MSVRTVAVTGAFGQVGRYLVGILLERGYRVVAVDVDTKKTQTAAQELIERAPAGLLVPAFVDLLDADSVERTLTESNPEAIVHLAGVLAPVSYRNPRQARRVNVDGTKSLLAAALKLPAKPFVVFASSAAVYGSRNPHRYPERITGSTPIAPVDQYGQDKALAEAAIVASGLPYAILRLGGVISPHGAADFNPDYLVLMRATPGDNRLHTVDCRDVALAFANAVDRRDAVAGKVFVIGGDDSHLNTHRGLEDDMMAAMGIGRLGPGASLPGDPNDDRGWSFTGWFDTTESQSMLEFQEHDWPSTLAWVAASQAKRRPVMTVLGPVLRPIMRTALAIQRAREHRGPYADPWRLIEARYGPEALASSSPEPSPNSSSER